MTREAKRKIKTHAIDCKKRKRFSFMCNMILFDKDGGWLWHNFGRACYATLPLNKDWQPKFFFDNPCLSNVDSHVISRSQQAEYFHWLAKKSTWADVFITKSFAEAEDIGIIYSCEFPTRFVIQSGCLVRYLRERPELIRSFLKLKKYMEPHAALVLAHYINIGKSVFNKTTPPGGHSSWESRQIGAEQIRLMQQHAPFFHEPPMSEKICYWTPLAASWHKEFSTRYSKIDNMTTKLKFPTMPTVAVESNVVPGLKMEISRGNNSTLEQYVEEFCRLNGVEK
jgi:hypothetical protein